MVSTIIQLLAEGNGGPARGGQEEAEAQIHEPTNRNNIQGQVRGRVRTIEQSPGFSGHGKCCGCVVKVHVLIRGDLFDGRPLRGSAMGGNLHGVQAGVSRGHSSLKRRRAELRTGKVPQCALIIR